MATVVALAGSASAATIDVPQDQPTIQDGVDAADPGDIVSINKAKAFRENVTVPTNNVTIEGAPGLQGVIVDGGPPDSNDIFNITGNDVTIRNLTARHGDAINCIADGCAFEGVTVLSETDDCINIQGKRGRVVDSILKPCGDDRAIQLDGNNFLIARNQISQSDNTCVEVDGNGGEIIDNDVHNCEDSDGINLEGSKNLIEGNRVASVDDIGVEVSGDDNDVVGNFAENIEAVCFDGLGDRNLFSGNATEGCYDHSYEIDGDRMKVIGNSAFAGATDDDCFDLNGGVNPVVKNNVADLCDGGWEVTGENMKVIGNIGTRLGDDDGFDIDCGDQTGGADPDAACSIGVVRGNSASDNNNDDEGFDIFIPSGTGAGFEIVGNTSQDNNDGGFNINATRALIEGNVSRDDGSEGNEPAFEIRGVKNRVIGNSAFRGAEHGFEINGERHVLKNNLAEANFYDGFNIYGETSDPGNEATDISMTGNRAIGNHGDGIDNGGLDTKLRNNESRGNGRVDCGNEGTIAVEEGNVCDDGSDFDEPGVIDS